MAHFFLHFHALSFELNFFFDRRFPLNISFSKVTKETVRNYAAVSVCRTIKVRNYKLNNISLSSSGTGRS